MFEKTIVCSALMAAFGGTMLVLASPAAAQQLERVEITGSSLRRVEAETALPVTVLRVDELTRQGVTNVEQAMSRLSSNQSRINTATGGGKAEADIRGLSGPTGNNSNKTLLLLNGRRIANHAFDAAAVDLNAIPLAAVDRIEVLRDGASAIYGTDAIGGVINFILRRDFKGLELSAQAIVPEASGGGDTKRFSLTGGYGSLTEQRFNILASIDHRKQKALGAEKRSFASTGVLRGRVTEGTSGSSFPGDVNGFEPTLPTCNPPSSIPNPAGTSCRYDFTRDIDIILENEQLTGLVRGSLALAPDHTASVEYLRSRTDTTARIAPTPVSHLIPTTSPFYPAGAPTTAGGIPDLNNPGGPNIPGGVVNWREVPAGKRTGDNVTVTDRAMFELQGVLGGFDYRTAFGRSRHKSVLSVQRGYMNNDIMQAGVFNGVINPFGAQTAAGIAAIESAQLAERVQVGEYKLEFFDFRVVRDLAQLPAGPLSGAVGVEFRKERSFFDALPINALLINSLGIDPDSDTSGDRKVHAAFAELNIPVIKTLEVTAAVRFDKYSDFGNTINPKVGVRYQPVKQVLVRGSMNKGFRAPTLYEVYRPASLGFTSAPHNDPLLCPGGTPVAGASAGVVCSQQVLVRRGGPGGLGQPIDSVKPEKSNTWTFGLVFEPVPSVTLGIDYWNITVKDLISPLPEQAIFRDPTKYAGKFVRCSQLPAGPGPGINRSDIDVCLNFPSFDPIAFVDNPFENLGKLKTSGIDLSAAWRTGSTPYGNFGLGFDGTYVTEYKYQREKGGTFIDALGRYSDSAPVFRWQHVLSINWRIGPWSTTFAQRYKSGYTDQDESNRVGSYVLHDVAVSWTGVKNLTLTAGINNLFDKDPPESLQVSTSHRGYDPRFTDPLGRSFAILAAYRF